MRGVALRPGYAITPVIRGGWQLAGGHGAIDAARAVDDLLATFDAGVTTFDCADIYTGVEELHGALRERLLRERGAAAAASLKVHTKLVPDLDELARLDRAAIERMIDRSLRRLRVERLDLVQLHWWDNEIPGAVDAMLALEGLRRAGKLRHVGATNFDVGEVRAFLAAGVELVSLQVQYSLLDPRPAAALAPMAESAGVHLLCYGSVAGGFLSDRWLGAPEPLGAQENRSLTKYKLIIDEFGGWTLFQALLGALRRVADRHGTDIASIASRAILDRQAVAAIIVGARDRAHVAANAAIPTIPLDDNDRDAIAAVLARATGPHGGVYALERDRAGRHGAIMKYNLNSDRGTAAAVEGAS